MEKRDWCRYTVVKKFGNMFSHFDRILACDRQIDILRQHSLCYTWQAVKSKPKVYMFCTCTINITLHISLHITCNFMLTFMTITTKFQYYVTCGMINYSDHDTTWCIFISFGILAQWTWECDRWTRECRRLRQLCYCRPNVKFIKCAKIIKSKFWKLIPGYFMYRKMGWIQQVL